jgi:hypothetical protein
MKRFIEFDVLRGVLLLMMSADHSPSSLRRFTDQPLGFFSKLPVFCSQICLSLLLIGRTESGLTIEPITSALVICQLLTAPLFAWFLERRSVAKQSARPIAPALGAKHQISLAETRMRGRLLPSRTVRQPVLYPL